jgi:AcrR family transcriptional regulator
MATVPASDLAAYARIRNAALASFARDGVEASSIREIAREAGVSPGLVQHYFPTKAALRDTVNEHVIALVAEPFRDVPLDPADGDPFEELGNRITALVGEHPEAVRYAARAIVEGDAAALALFDAFIAIARGQWEQLAEAGLLREELDRDWTALHVVIFNLATILFRAAIERHLPASFLEPEQLRRWNVATTDLLREGALRRP